MDAQVELEELKQKLALLENRVVELEAEKNRAEKYRDDAEVGRVFDELMEQCSATSLQRIIRETSIDDWARASVGMSLAALTKIRNNVSVRAWGDFKERALEVENLRGVASYRREILRTVDLLEQMGEIILPWRESLVEPLRVQEPDPVAEAADRARSQRQVMEWRENTLMGVDKAPLKRP
jgi:hypothetical protein